MANLKQLLGGLTKVDGINTAIVVGRDGFVIDSAGSGNDAEALGAIVATALGSSEVMGTELRVGGLRQVLLEYASGTIVLSTLGAEAILAVVADTAANLGNVRYNVKKMSPDFERVL